MKKLAVILLVFPVPSVVSAGTMVITGLPEVVDTSGGDVVLSFDIVSNGQLDNDSIEIWTYTGATLDIASAVNVINPGPKIDDDPVNRRVLEDWYGIDITNVTQPVLWADIALPKLPEVIVGDIITGIGLTVASGFEGLIDVKVLSENFELVEGVATIEAIPEPATIALLALGTLLLRRRKS